MTELLDIGGARKRKGGKGGGAASSAVGTARSAFFNGRTRSADIAFVEVPPSEGKASAAPFPRLDFVGMNFHKTTMDPLLDQLIKASDSPKFRYLVTPNVDHLVTLEKSNPDSDLRRAFDDADLRVCDSRILSLLAKGSGLKLPAVPGSDVTKRLLDRLPAGTKVAVIGGNANIHADLRRKYSGLEWSFLAPPMGVLHSPLQQKVIADFVARSGADVCLFAIGSPQSEIVCRLISDLNQSRGVALCIGASLEFITGAKKRAPLWVQKAHCEWLFRLLCEPRRLAHRYLVKGPRIFSLWLNWRKTQVS